jgi:protein SCO1/2
MERKFLWVALGLAVVVVVAVAAAALLRGGGDEAYNGSVINPPSPAADFTLTGPGGGTAHLSDFRGKVVLLFFGYTNCPDECPTTMAVLRKARADLGAQGDQVQVLLVTTDPARDTPERLATYLAAFDPTFIGLTGADADLQAVYAQYGVTVMDQGETHSTRVYVIDAAGNLRLTLPYGLTPDQVVADLRRIFQGD